MRSALLFATFFVLLPGGVLAQTPNAERPDPPQKGKPAPDFRLKDLTGKPRTLAALKGRPVALFFFCGCSFCYDTAREWANALPSVQAVKKGTPRPQTVIVYTEMSVASAGTLAKSAGLSEKDALFLRDPDLRVARDLYQAEPCPRIFVVDARGILRYTNSHADDQPRSAPTALLIARTVDALRP